MENINNSINLIQLKETINKIGLIENSDEVISDIFEMNFIKNNKDSLQEISIHLQEAFNMDCEIILTYILSHENFEETLLSDCENKLILKAVHRLKRIYGYPLRKINTINKNPFCISGMSITMDKEETMFSMTINRADGEYLDSIMNTNELMNLINFSSVNLDKIITDGKYNMDINIINNYIKISKELVNKLENLLKGVSR